MCRDSLDWLQFQKLDNSDVPFWRKVEKTSFFCHFKRIKGGQRRLRFFFENPLGTFLWPIHVLPNCKVSEKSNERFSRNCVTYERTNGRTDGRTNVIPQVSNDFVERPPKNLHFQAFWAKKDNFGHKFMEKISNL